MASINWKKMTAKDLDSSSIHFEKEMRLSHNHSNENIDKDKSYLNYDLENGYKDSIYRLKDKVKQIDKIIPPKKKFGYDKRVIAVALETPCPDEISKLSEKAEDDFFKTIYKCEKAFFGFRVFYGGVHKDEKHTYVNPITKKIETSKNHLHTFILPYEKAYGINGRNFVSKKLIIKFNKYCDTAIYRQFGIHLNNGKGKNNWGNVESLKEQSKCFELNLSKEDKDIVKLKRDNNALLDRSDEYFSSTYIVMKFLKNANQKEYVSFASKEHKTNRVISGILRLLSEEQYGSNYLTKDPIWAELEREEEEKKKKKKMEELQKERNI